MTLVSIVFQGVYRLGPATYFSIPGQFDLDIWDPFIFFLQGLYWTSQMFIWMMHCYSSTQFALTQTKGQIMLRSYVRPFVRKQQLQRIWKKRSTKQKLKNMVFVFLSWCYLKLGVPFGLFLIDTHKCYIVLKSRFLPSFSASKDRVRKERKADRKKEIKDGGRKHHWLEPLIECGENRI